jgi:pyroglutamyl-peptidase
MWAIMRCSPHLATVGVLEEDAVCYLGQVRGGRRAMLLTGFEGYGGRAVNPSEEVVRRLHGTRIAGVAVEGRTLPVRYLELGPRIAALMEEVRPQAVLCLGLWPGEPLLRLERIAVNIADFEIPDNAGFVTRGPVVEGGAEAYRSTLPLDRIRERLLAAAIPARLSSTAGNFLCNALMYQALRLCAGRTPAPPCGFIHLPYLPAQVAGMLAETERQARLELHQRSDLASMALETQVEGIRLAIETILEVALA